MTQSMIIDIHPHIIANDDTRYPRSPLFGVQSTWSQKRPVSAEQMIAEMDAAGVQKSAVVQASTCYGYDNSYLADSIARFPQRFTGVCSVDVRAPDARQRMAEWKQRGMSGMRLFTGGSTAEMDASWLNDPLAAPAWNYAGEIGWSVCIQTNQSGLPEIVKLAQRFPQVRIVLDHIARADITDGPPYAAAQSLFDLVKYPNVYLKVTPRAFNSAREGKASPESFFPRLVGVFGANRLAWGSNYPASEGPLSALLGVAKASLACLSDADRAWIFAGTAQVLYPALA
jgi:L-fuconolactonase